MKKIALFLVLLVSFSVAASAQNAQPWIDKDKIEFSPSDPIPGEEITVSATAEDDGRILFFSADLPKSADWNTKNCDVYLECTKEWSFSVDESGTYDVGFRAQDSKYQYSDTVTKTIDIGSEKPEITLDRPRNRASDSTPSFEWRIDDDQDEMESVEIAVDTEGDNLFLYPDKDEIFRSGYKVEANEDISFNPDWKFEEGKTYYWGIEADDGEHTVEKTTSFTIEEEDEAFFDVNIEGTNSPVTEGETLDVDYEIENTGDQQGTKNVELEIGGEVRDNREMTVGAGDSSTGVLEWKTSSGDVGVYDVKIQSPDDQAETEITVDEADENARIVDEGPEGSEQNPVELFVELDKEGSSYSCYWDDYSSVSEDDEEMSYEGSNQFTLEETFSEGDNTVHFQCFDGYKSTDTASTTFKVEKSNEKPSAYFTYSPGSPEVGQEVEFDASGSSDSDGSIIDYEWDFDDGSTGTGEQEEHIFDSSGTYNVELTVEDSDDETDTYESSVYVDQAGQQCGIDQEGLSLSVDDDTVQEGDQTTARVSLSNTGDSNQHVNVDFLYNNDELGDREGDVPKGGSKTFTMQVSPESDGYVRADVSTSGDACGDREFDRLNQEITVTSGGEEGDEAPTASIDYDPEDPTTETTVSFDGEDSYDDNGIVNYEWSFGDGSESSGSQVTHSYDRPGEYTVQLEVEDSAGQTDTATETVTVDAVESECGVTQDSMHLSASETLIEEGESTNLRLRVSNLGDENQDIDYRFELGSQTIRTGSATVPNGGTQEIAEEVSPSGDTYARAHVSTSGGNCGDQDFERLNQEITVTSSEEPEDEEPRAQFTYTPQNPVVDEEVKFDAAPSTDDNGITSYNWSFGDGSESSGETVTHSFNDDGPHPVTLTVEDTSGQKDSRLRYVTVGEPEQTCGVSSKNIQLSLEDYIIERGESTNADLRIFNTGDQNQDVRIRLLEGNSVFEDTTLTVPAFGSQTVTRSVSPEEDTYIRAEVSTKVEPCGDRNYQRKNKEITVISDETEEASLDVRVEEEGGAPLRNAEVSVDGPEELTRFTDSNGRQGFSLEPGQYDVEVSHRDYETQEKSVRLYEGDYKDLDFTMGDLEGEGRFEAKVKNGDGDWIEDAHVRVENGEYEVEGTDNYGQADFTLDSGRYDVRVSHSDYETVDRASIRVERGETTHRTFRLYEDDEYGDGDRGLTVASTDFPDTVCRGDTLPVDVKIRNNADRDEYVTVTGKGLGSIKVLDSFILDEGESAERTVRFTNVEGSGTETFRVQARNGTRDEVRRTVEVESCDYTPPEDGGTVSTPEGISMKLSYPVAPNKAIIGDTVKVSGFVDGVNRRSEVEIEVNGERKARVSTQPDGYYQTFITVDEVGMKTVTARAEGKSASREIQVLPSASTGILKTPRKVFEGETFEACTEVTSPVEAKVVLLEDGKPIKSTNANGEVCFDVEAQQPGEHFYEVRALTSGTDSSSRSTVTVLKSDVEVKSFPGQVAAVESGSGQIKIDLYNTHEEETRYNLELEGLPETWTSQTSKQVVLTKGEEKTVYFYLTPREEGSFTPELKVEAENQLIYNEEIPLETQGQKEPRQRGFLERLGGLFSF